MAFERGQSSAQGARANAPNPPVRGSSAPHPDPFEYSDGIAVLIAWDKSGNGCSTESDNLEEVFRRYYKYTTLKLPISRPIDPDFNLYVALVETLQNSAATKGINCSRCLQTYELTPGSKGKESFP